MIQIHLVQPPLQRHKLDLLRLAMPQQLPNHLLRRHLRGVRGQVAGKRSGFICCLALKPLYYQEQTEKRDV